MVIIVACLSIFLVADQSLAQKPVRLFLEITPRLASLRQTTVSPEVVSEYPLPSELLWEYQRAPNPRKPYVRFWATPSGWNILRDAPADHLHHHGLMFAIGVDEVDFWAEDASSGHQREAAPLNGGTFSLEDTPGSAVRVAWLSHELEWTSSDQTQVLLREVRKLAWVDLGARGNQPPVRFILWCSQLRLPEGKESARLWGRPYFGLGIRFVAEMDRIGRFINALGGQGVEQTNNVPAPWCAYQVSAGDREITVAMFDHPSNPRHPATWFTMVEPFAYLSATIGLHKEPLTLRRGDTCTLVYCVAVWDRLLRAEEIAATYSDNFLPIWKKVAERLPRD